MFGYEIPGIIHPPARQLKLHDPRVINRYNELYAECLQSDGLSRCIFQLEMLAAYPAQPKLEVEFDILDCLRVQGMAWADRRCRKF